MTKPLRILVVEDNAVTRKMLRVALQTEGYSVLEAADARAALAAARNGMPDLIVQDLILPDADGFDLALQLRALPGGSAVPIVAVSGFVGRMDEARTARAGFTSMLLKPVEPSRLLECVSALLPRRSQEAGVGAGIQLLVVDDDPVQLKLLRVHLTQFGFAVTEASGAEQALRLALERPPDVVVSDILMRSIDGFQLCGDVRRNPALSNVPVVLLSAHYTGDADRALAERVGASALVQRSPTLDELVPAILHARRSGAPPAPAQPSAELRLEHAQAVARQLERQVSINNGIARRCTVQAAQLSLLGGIADALSRHSDTAVALHDVLAATLDAAAISKGALFLVEDGGALNLRDAIGFNIVERAALSSFFGHRELLMQILEEKVPVAVPSENVARSVASDILSNAGAAQVEVVPLVSEGHAVGAIVLAAGETDVGSNEAVVFARAIGNQIVQSLELERSFRRLSESERRYRAVLENAHDAISILTPDCVFREVNGRLSALLGLPKDKIVGRPLTSFLSPHAAQASSGGGLAQDPDAGRSRPVELARPDGTTLFVEFSNSRIDIAGEELLVSIGRDVTDELRAQAQLLISDRMASIGMLAAGVAHEINNPLAAVIANLDLAARDLSVLKKQVGSPAALDPLTSEVRDARDAAARVKAIVRDLKVFSRVEQEPRTRVDVHRVLDSVTRMAWNEIRHRAQLVKDYGPIPWVLANESRLGQIFLNLIVNAAQAIPEGKANLNQIALRTWASKARDSVFVSVSDTGTGMSAETCRKLFTPFFTTKPHGLGTGLGLAICHRLVTELGGEISVESELGRGTTLRVSLPASMEEAERPSRAAPPFVAPGKHRILVVDDEALVGNVVRRSLMADHDVVYLPSAEDALKRILGGERYDLILCDLMMPVMTGMELHRRLLEEVPTQAARMAFLTGGAFTAAARTFLESVPNARLEKPFDLHGLEAFVNERLQELGKATKEEPP